MDFIEIIAISKNVNPDTEVGILAFGPTRLILKNRREVLTADTGIHKVAHSVYEMASVPINLHYNDPCFHQV
jgi:hypothetical protein